ncbi:response regulator [bacterium]|nr:response regulator [bacterium]
MENLDTSREHGPLRETVRILVIEDEPAMRDLMVKVLTRAGCDVEAAETGTEGLRLAGHGGFDLIASDIDLPKMTGFEICSRLKRDPQLRHTPVVFISGRLAEEDVRRSRQVGAADYITKPFDARSFVSRLLAHVKYATPLKLQK